jgi:hypothetical protein
MFKRVLDDELFLRWKIRVFKQKAKAKMYPKKNLQKGRARK